MSTVDQIKGMQRSVEGFKGQWWAYCDSQGGGVRDPAKHDEAFLQVFLAQYSSGVRVDDPLNEPDMSMAGFIQEAQKKSSAFKRAWQNYCRENGKGKNDPNIHPQKFIIGFLDHVGQASAGPAPGRAMMPMMQSMMPMMQSMMGGGMAGGWSPMANAMVPMAKRQRTEGPASGGAQKDKLVEAVKNFQKSSEDAKQTWWFFCDSEHDGIRDPKRHELSTLRGFLQSNGIKVASGPAGSAQKDKLVDLVKSFQKSGEENKQAWWYFCDNEHAGTGKDPARYDLASLKQFCQENGLI